MSFYIQWLERNKKQPVPLVTPVTVDKVLPTSEPVDRSDKLRGKTWSLADEVACTAQCRRCDQPIIWGQIESDTSDSSVVGKWMPLDPDLVPHVCTYKSRNKCLDGLENYEQANKVKDTT